MSTSQVVIRHIMCHPASEIQEKFVFFWKKDGEMCKIKEKFKKICPILKSKKASKMFDVLPQCDKSLRQTRKAL